MGKVPPVITIIFLYESVYHHNISLNSMYALKLAFELVIVGALALPWLALAIDVFSRFRLADVWKFIKSEKDSVHPAVGGILLFALAYFLGAAISRVSEDFFNDDDLDVRITEDHIRAAVFCSSGESLLGKVVPLLPSNEKFLFGMVVESCSKDRSLIRQVFNLEESDLLLQGGDKMDRLNNLHSQIAVMRGAAFDAIVAAALCLFGLCGKLPSRHRVFLAIMPIACVALSGRLLRNHYLSHGLDDPPFMEYTFILLSLAFGSAVWSGAPARARTYGTGLVLSLLFFWLAYFGWWWTEVRYDQQLVHSFYAQYLTLTAVRK